MKIKKILKSTFLIAVTAFLVIGATRAFFSDTETSVGNRFQAGDIDLRIDNTSYAVDWNIPGYVNPIGAFVASTHTSWQLRDLTIEKFFDFVDLKPGDYGEDTISVHVGSNDAWVCAEAKLTSDIDNTYTEPELVDDLTDGGDPLLTDGELDSEVNFAFWVDDGDNVYEIGENIFLQGPLSGLDGEGQMTLADSQGGILGANTPIPGGSTFYIGKYWCFGNMVPTPIAQGVNSPLQATGFTCDGSQTNNAAQTDLVTGDISFYAEQSRHNDRFLCSSVVEEEVTPTPTLIPTATPIPTVTPTPTSIPTPTPIACEVENDVLFANGFEDNYSSWILDPLANNDWGISNSIFHSGARAARVDDNNNETDNLRRDLSTSGYNNVVLSYWYRVSDALESDDEAIVEWSSDGGANWNELVNYNSTAANASWTQASHNLPVGAANNPNFRIRFRAIDLEGSSDTFRLDDVSVTGDTICPN